LSVEEVTRYSFLYIRAQLFPGVTLRKDIVRKAFGYEAAVSFLGYLKHNLHGVILSLSFNCSKH